MIRTPRVRRATQYLRDIQAGRGWADNRPAQPNVPVGMRIPTPPPREESDDGTTEGTEPELIEEIGAMAMTVEMANALGLEPRTFAEAKRSPAWPQWKDAMEEEHNALEVHKTWRLEKPPPGFKVIGNQWVYHVKRDAAGAINRYRARLVILGNHQRPGIDCFDTYAPVAKIASIRVVLAMAARHDFEIHQIDVKSAYLNREFEANEVIYMKVPQGLKLTNDPSLALRLLRPLYGLRQSGRQWYKKLWEILRDELRMNRCEVDQAVFFRSEETGLIVIVVHVDDLTIVTSTLALMEEVKEGLKKRLRITDQGEIHWILGISIKRDRANKTIMLGQVSYLNSILQRYGFENVKRLAMPMDPHVQLSSDQAPKTQAEFAAMRNVPYREAVGSLMYLAMGTRPDIAYAVGIVSRFCQNPGQAHWNAVKRIFAYLAGSREMQLMYGGEKRALVGYSDADGSMNEDRHAITGYAFMLDGGAVSWCSKKQEVVALSTAEAEYVAVSHGTKEALWLRSLIGQVFGHFTEPTTLHSDNQAAIALSEDHRYHARTKHIDIRFHFVRWVISEGHIKLVYCPTNDMVADTLTKALPSVKVKHFARELGLCMN
jgi:hypothetical protein